MDIENLSTAARRRAGLAIENTHKEYTKEGGLRDREKEKSEAEQKCSTYIFGLAQFAAQNRPKSVSTEDMFATLCKYAESQFKDKHNVTNVEDALPVWKVFKSNINRGLRAGLDPKKFETEWEFRKATAESAGVNIGARTPSHKGPIERTERVNGNGEAASVAAPATPRPAIVESAEEMLETTTIRPNLRERLARLVVQAEYVKPGAEDEAEKILDEAFRKLATLIDRRRIRDSATKEALRAALH